jgi:Zn-dependent M28 family amino/carboxypeptidase
MGGSSRRFARLLCALLVAVVLPGLAVPPALADKSDVERSERLREAVTVGGIRAHQRALQEIANANGGNRQAGFKGYDDSARYVAQQAQAAGLRVSLQEFTFLLVSDRTPPVMQKISPTPRTYTDGVDFASMQYSGSGDVTAPVTAVDLVVPSPAPNASTSGCESADFAGFPVGSIALLQRGTCTFRVKADNARAAGAVAVVVFNEGNLGRTSVLGGTLNPPIFDRPVVGTTFAVGDELRNGVLNGPTGVTLRVRTDTVAEERTTRNVIAETRKGDPSSVVVVGAHLDSVSRGPGINDNGSGAGTILEIAEAFEREVHSPRNKVRFIWFGAEEQGLLGSEHYVTSLSAAERGQIRLMLNFDMVGSPNFVRFVYDGDNSTFPASPPTVQQGPPGSGAIEQVFRDYFAARRLPVEPTPFNGRSDYGPFIEVGIPAGGLFTGAEGEKTAQEAAVYGGVAGQPYDPCYHLACDTFANNSDRALDQMSDAAAHAVHVFAERRFAREPLVDPAAAARAAAVGRAGWLDDAGRDPATR